MVKERAEKIVAEIAIRHNQFKPGRLSVFGEGKRGSHAVIDFEPIDGDIRRVAKWFPADVLAYHFGKDECAGVMYAYFRDRDHLDDLVDTVGEETVLSMLSDYFADDKSDEA